ncbi:SDR family NAD(P)-dependent oxidoreductase [Gloeocapsa sp. PCC 73106]|uniref:SDR family NAD(P)-dependent oxidoreductase n=1 Tax=Gloeocapsa sp. PCC 73106 TaxID=102232 RepID=UPI0002ABB586|nr:SDR family NAD(P)-dependent oxidoreductase [Gloeocapsa sp. PCC 73106]ELR98608.1 dehydrogenase of unknown specificity [Gloeocapsa sp. PCC 73106]
MKTLQGKIALVTGATRGIGKGIAIALGEAGATIYITGRSDTLTATSAEVIAAGGQCIPVQIDHSDDTAVATLFERIDNEQNGQLDLLVNNAFSGVKVLRDNQGKSFWEGDLNLWDACNNVGLRSHYIASVYAAKIMTKRRQGLICTISSWGSLNYIFGVAYGTGKAACDRLAADMAVELKQHNVASLSLWPGIVGTEEITQWAREFPTQNPAISAGYNWETPLFTGRVLAALAAEPQIMRLTGTTQIVAELAHDYGILDENGVRPASFRSLRFILPLVIPELRNYAQFLPDLHVPWFLLLLNALSSPKFRKF